MEENFDEKIKFYSNLFDVTDVLLDDDKMDELFLAKEKEDLNNFFEVTSEYLSDLQDYANNMLKVIADYRTEIEAD